MVTLAYGGQSKQPPAPPRPSLRDRAVAIEAARQTEAAEQAAVQRATLERDVRRTFADWLARGFGVGICDCEAVIVWDEGSTAPGGSGVILYTAHDVTLKVQFSGYYWRDNRTAGFPLGGEALTSCPDCGSPIHVCDIDDLAALGHALAGLRSCNAACALARSVATGAVSG